MTETQSHSSFSFVFQHAPGVPRILVGNRLHLAFKRQVPTEQARAYAEKNSMTFFEVSPLCNFNVIESFTELSRIVLMRHGMEKFWRPNRGESVNRFFFLCVHFFLFQNEHRKKYIIDYLQRKNSYTDYNYNLFLFEYKLRKFM